MKIFTFNDFKVYLLVILVLYIYIITELKIYKYDRKSH